MHARRPLLFAAVGMQGAFDIRTPHLADRRRQHEPVHARIRGWIAGRLGRAGWVVATVVPIGTAPPRGWIDVLAYREADAAELTTELRDPPQRALSRGRRGSGR